MIINPYVYASSNFVYAPALILDPYDLTTLFQDSGGTTPVTTDGQPVGLWQDKSGNGRHFFQATAGSRPTFRSSAGINWVEFDGTNDWLRGSTSDLSFTRVAVCIGYKPTVGVSDFANVIGVPQNTTHVSPFYRWNLSIRTSGGVNHGIQSQGSQFYRNDAAAAVGNNLIKWAGVDDCWAASVSAQRARVIRLNKTEVTQSTPTTTQTYPNATYPVIGSSVIGGGDFFKGAIYGVLVGNAAVTAQAQIDEWETWADLRTP
jgi:hypothetical protein